MIPAIQFEHLDTPSALIHELLWQGEYDFAYHLESIFADLEPNEGDDYEMIADDYHSCLNEVLEMLETLTKHYKRVPVEHLYKIIKTIHQFI